MNRPASQNVRGAEPLKIDPEIERKDAITGGLFVIRRPYSRVPTPDPVPQTLSQYQIETYNRPQMLERILHADIGDPELGMEEAPPYVRVHPRGISLGVRPGIAEMVMDSRHGTVFVGNVAFRNPAEMFSFGGICSLNPLLMNCVPSTAATPISTMIFSLRVPPMVRNAVRSSEGSPAAKALKAPAESIPSTSGPPRRWNVTMDTGQQLIVEGPRSGEEARAQAMKAANTQGTGHRVAKIEAGEELEETGENPFYELGTITSPYGERIHPILGTRKFHKGLDIAAPHGTPIAAFSGGVVERVWVSSSYGNVLDIRAVDGTLNRYAHLSAVMVKEGDVIKRGELVARVGSTGRSTGPHLHFEVSDGDQTIDPEQWIKA